jgi:ubiquinone biosynthesis accessory factor UbiK
MALKPPPPPWEVLQQVSEFVGAGKGEVDKGMRSLVQSALARLDLVSREDFDAQSEILQRTRARVAALENAVEELARELESKNRAG